MTAVRTAATFEANETNWAFVAVGDVAIVRYQQVKRLRWSHT
jgi:hypothetical protein